MIKAVYSNASYLRNQKGCRRVGGYFFLSKNSTFLPNNGVVYHTAQNIKAVMMPAAEEELGTLYVDTKHMSPLHHTLHDLVNP